MSGQTTLDFATSVRAERAAPFTVTLAGPRTRWGDSVDVTFAGWSAGVSGHRYLAATLCDAKGNDSPDCVQGSIAGASFRWAHIEVKDRAGDGEPTIWSTRRLVGHGYVDQAWTDQARKTIVAAVAQALQRAGGFEQVWQRTFLSGRLREVAARQAKEAADTAADARYMQACADLGAAIAADPDAFTFEIVPEACYRTSERLQVKVFSYGYRPEWSRPSTRVLLNGEQVGWLSKEGWPVVFTGKEAG